jgi:hypothetical protein
MGDFKMDEIKKQKKKRLAIFLLGIIIGDFTNGTTKNNKV